MIEKIQAIVEPYGIRVMDAELITKGFLSENYKVIAESGTFFLKQYRASIDAARVQDIHKSKYFFAERGIPVVLPLSLEGEKSFVAYEEKFYALFPFVDGNNYPDQRCSIQELQSLARMLARVHDIGAAAAAGHIEKKFERKSFEAARVHGSDIVKKIEAEIAMTGGSEFDFAALQIVNKKIALLGAWPFADEAMAPHILVHYDLHAGNIFFDAAGDAQHVFDFELTQYEPAAFDVIRTMTIVCLDYGSAEEKWKRVEEFMRAYREVRAMSAEEFRAGVLEFAIYRTTTFWVEEEHYLKNNARVDRFLECDDVSRIMWIEWLQK